MKINQLKSGVILAYCTQAVYILTSILYTPIMLRLLGQSEYGLYQLVYTLVSYLGLLSFGFGAGYMRFYAGYKVKEDSGAIAKLNGMFMLIFSAIALICILCGAVMLFNADKIFNDGLSGAELTKARILMSVMIFNMALTFVTNVFSSYITAHERFFFQRLIEFLRVLFNPFLTLPLLLAGYGSVGMVSVSALLTVFVLAMNVWYCFTRLNMKFSFKGFDVSLLKEMFVFTFFIFINMIVDQINWSIDKLLLGRMMGTAAVAVYGIAAQLNTMYISLSTNISGVFVPRVNMLVASGKDNRTITGMFTQIGRIQFVVAALAVSGYVMFGREFISIWAGEEYYGAYRVGLFLMLPVTIPMLQNVGIEIQRAKNMHRARSVVYLAVAVSNIFVSIPCIRKWGIDGAAFGTALTLIIGNGLFMNIYYHKKMGLDMICFWKQILKMLPALLAAVAAGAAAKHIIGCTTIAALAVNIAVYCAVYAVSMWFVGLNTAERETVKKHFVKERV